MGSPFDFAQGRRNRGYNGATATAEICRRGATRRRLVQLGFRQAQNDKLERGGRRRRTGRMPVPLCRHVYVG
jgi:hypothetical protein